MSMLVGGVGGEEGWGVVNQLVLTGVSSHNGGM